MRAYSKYTSVLVFVSIVPTEYKDLELVPSMGII